MTWQKKSLQGSQTGFTSRLLQPNGASVFSSVKLGIMVILSGLPRWCCGKEPTCWCRRCRKHSFNPCIGTIPWSRKWQPSPVFLSGKYHGTEEPGRLQSKGSHVHISLKGSSCFYLLVSPSIVIPFLVLFYFWWATWPWESHFLLWQVNLSFFSLKWETVDFQTVLLGNLKQRQEERRGEGQTVFRASTSESRVYLSLLFHAWISCYLSLRK